MFTFIDSGEFGFPLSKFLLAQQFTLGRNARMLANHAIDRAAAREEVIVDT